MKISRSSGRRFIARILVASALLLAISATGCSRRFVVVPQGETVEISKGSLDQVYQSNELLLQALEEAEAELEQCREALR